MHVVKTSSKGVESIDAKQIDFESAATAKSSLAKKILISLKDPTYPKELSRRLKVHEQKIYYYIRRLENAGLIKQIEQKDIGGTPADIYTRTAKAFCILLGDFKSSPGLFSISSSPEKFLEPFIQNGVFNARIIVGSPDPHGKEMARSRDGYFAVDFGLFLGTFLKSIPKLSVKLDTEVKESDLKDNLILVGGPIVNTITAKVNSTLPVFFNKNKGWSIESKISKKSYPQEQAGIIAKVKNPFNKKSSILVLAGKRSAGTRAVMATFLKLFKDINSGNAFDQSCAKVVEGIDEDSDGVIDSARILE